MAFRRKGSPYYQIRRKKLIGYGDTGQLSSGTPNKKVANRMEQALQDLAERALLEPRYRSVLDAVCRDRALSPAELLASRRNLESLLIRLDDPLLSDAVETYRKASSDCHVTAAGLAELLKYVPNGVRLSYLDSKRVTALCHVSMESRHRNTVVRQFKRAVSKLLRFHLGTAKRNEIFADVNFQGVDDTREVHLDTGQIRDLLIACHNLGYPELSVVIRAALLTSADRGVLLSGPAHHGKVARGLLVRDLRVFGDESGHWGEVHLNDTKAKGRTRTVSIGQDLASDLLALANGKDPDEPVFSMAYRDLDYKWKAVRGRAGLEHVRFKDLRAQISQYGEEAGIPPTVLQGAMGHADGSMTRRYQQRQTLLTRGHAEAIEGAMGLVSLQSGLQSEKTSIAVSP